MYKKPCVLMVKDSDGEFPSFAKLHNVYVVNEVPQFHIELLVTDHFNQHFHCFIVKGTTRRVCVKQDQLRTHITHHIRYLPGQQNAMCIVPKYYFHH